MPNWEDEGGKHKMGILYSYLVIHRLMWDTDSGCFWLNIFVKTPTFHAWEYK